MTDDTQAPEAPEAPATALAPEAPEESKEALKSELPSELKTVHESPAPRDSPIAQEDDIPTDRAERERLLDQAIAFLETGSVRDAPLQEKQEFLRAKGLTPAEVEELILKVDGKKRRRAKRKQRDEARNQRVASSPQPYQAQQPQQSPTIVTYPEWLAPPPPAAPRPLVTGTTLVKSIYFGAATAATVYGANKLVVTPMLEALTTARLDFAGTAKKNLDQMISGLMELVPPSYIPNKPIQRIRDNDEESEASDTSDPSELFHVDVQTQTEPSLAGHGDDDEMGTGTMTPDSKLEELTSQMKVLVESHSDGTDNELAFLLEDLTSYLEGLNYGSVVSSNMYSSPFGGFGQQPEKDKDDPIVKVKQEIRSVKGVLLNTKNFPAIR